MVINALEPNTKTLLNPCYFLMPREFNTDDFPIFLPIFHNETLCYERPLPVLQDSLPPFTFWLWILTVSSSVLQFSKWIALNSLPWDKDHASEHTIPLQCKIQQLQWHRLRCHLRAHLTPGCGPYSASFPMRILLAPYSLSVIQMAQGTITSVIGFHLLM